MSHLRLAASTLVTVFLLALCALLVGPAFELTAYNSQGGIGAGGLPQFVVVSVALLAPLMFIQDVVRFRRTSHISGGFDFEDGDGAEARRTAFLGSTVLVLLAAYAFLWRWLGFLPASMLFMSVLCVVLAPKDRRTVRGIGTAIIFSILFCLGVWALFVYLLAVPLR